MTVELVTDAGGGAPEADALVRVQHARARDSVTEDLTLATFIDRCGEYFAGGGRPIDQPFQSRITDGMVRCYVAGDRVAGFARQFAAPGERNVLGIPAATTMFGRDETEPA